MHSCVEYFFRVNTPPPPSLEELLRFYEKNWISRGYESLEEEERYREYGKDILTRFWELHYDGFRMPIALERNFYVDIEGIKVQGFIDRVDKLVSGGLSIIDYKTNKDLFTADYLADDLQLTIYQMAAEQTWRLPVEQLTLYHLRSNTACTCPPRDFKQLEQTRQLILEVAEGISNEKFPATEHQYCPCDFPEYCPYYRHQYLSAATPPSRQELLPGIAAIDAVERYADLQTQIKELQLQLEETKQTIIEYCRSEELNRVFGNTCEITYKLMEKTGYTEEEVKAVLEPEGLWTQVQGLDPVRLKHLLADESIDSNIKNRLESLKHITSSYPQLRLKKHDGEEE